MEQRRGWFLPALKYRATPPKKMVNVDEWHLARVSRARRAFVLDSEGRA